MNKRRHDAQTKPFSRRRTRARHITSHRISRVRHSVYGMRRRVAAQEYHAEHRVHGTRVFVERLYTRDVISDDTRRRIDEGSELWKINNTSPAVHKTIAREGRGESAGGQFQTFAYATGLFPATEFGRRRHVIASFRTAAAARDPIRKQRLRIVAVLHAPY